jgi:hypothetical protein
MTDRPQRRRTLQNMSMRPRTPVTLSFGEYTGPFVRFTWPGSLRKGPARAGQVSEERDQCLDDAWNARDFRGAALLYPWPGQPQAILERFPRQLAPELLTVGDTELSVNVLRRTRSGLLIAGTPLCPLSTQTGRERLWTNDHRLVRFALEAGAKRIAP